MDSFNSAVHRGGLFQVRPGLLLGCCFVLLVFFLPDAIRGTHSLQWAVLSLATLAVAAGWLFLARHRQPNSPWRTMVALAASVCLTASLPAFLFEMSQVRWLMRHPGHRVFSAYVWPWVGRWGYNGWALLLLIVAGSSFGRGWARVAFVTACTLLLILRASMGTWVY